MTIGKNKKMIQSRNVQKMPKKLKIFNLQIHKDVEIEKNQNLYK